MTYLVCLPWIHGPSRDRCVAGLHPTVRARLVEVDNTVVNRGLSASWNIGAQRVLDDQLDWLVILSAGTRFGPSGGRDFVDLLDKYDPGDVWVVESEGPVLQHLMAWSRPMIEGVGLVDENFWPIYGQDADFSYRVHVAQREGWGGRWVKEPVDAWITMHGHATRLAGVHVDFDQIWAFYRAKWGGLSGHETFTRPFNDPQLPLSFWPRPPDSLAVDHEGWT